MKKLVKGILATAGIATMLATCSFTSCSTNKIWVISEAGYEEDGEYQVGATAERDEKGKIIVENNTIKLLPCDEDSESLEDTYVLMQYDGDGHQVCVMGVSEGVYVSENKYTYNEKGERIRESVWNGTTSRVNNYEYDEKGNLIKTIYCSAESGETYTAEIQYSYYAPDDKNRMVTIQNEEGVTIGNGTYVYNVDGGYTLSGKISVSYSFSSSKKGYTVSCSEEERQYSASGQLLRETSEYRETRYTYDEYGNMTEEAIYFINNDETTLMLKQIFKYESVKVTNA
jgi:YD repeat-containing protein